MSTINNIGVSEGEGGTRIYWSDVASALNSNFAALNADKLEYTDMYVADDILFVAKSGDDSNTGANDLAAFLTIEAAIVAASALTPSTTNRILIKVLDSGEYTENIIVPEYVSIQADKIRLIGTITLASNSVVHINEHYASSNDTLMVNKTNTTGRAFYKASICDGKGTSGTLTGSTAFSNSLSGSALFIEVDTLEADTAIDLDDGELYIHGSTVNGNIDIESPGTFYSMVPHYSGTITNNGTIQGKIGTHNEGNVFKNYSEQIKQHGSVGSGTISLDFNYPINVVEITGNVTIEIDTSTAPLAGDQGTIILEVTGADSNVITWRNGINVGENVPATLSTVSMFVLTTRDAGTTSRLTFAEGWTA